VGLYDVLRDVACGRRPSSDISFALNSVGDIQHRMLNFLENHDEQRLASDFFLQEGKKARAAMIVTACVNTNPVMIYAGQELGERGMDREGFSGRDGRTTIFDYWSPDTLRAWNNGGRWDDALLPPAAVQLRDFYCRLVRLCNEESALANGLYYDLMPPNYENSAFDSTSLFAFLRGDQGNHVLVIANCRDEAKTCSVIIPRHAYEFFGSGGEGEERSTVVLTPLLNRGGGQLQFTRDEPAEVRLPPRDGEVYRISLK